MKSHYRPGFYNCDKPYRDFIIEVLKKYGKTSFKNDEFWTLGGHEGHEFTHLIKNGIKFADNTYHNVDNGKLLQVGNMVRHENQEFLDINAIWDNPSVIAYDSVDGIVFANDQKWNVLTSLVAEAMQITNELIFIANFATSFGSIKWKNAGEYNEVLDSWSMVFDSRLTNLGYKVDFYPEACLAKRSNGKTEMLGFAFRVFR